MSTPIWGCDYIIPLLLTCASCASQQTQYGVLDVLCAYESGLLCLQGQQGMACLSACTLSGPMTSNLPDLGSSAHQWQS